MITEHIKKIQFNKIWIITLHSGATIEGSINLAESIEKAGLYCHPRPELSCTIDLTKTELLRSAA